MLEHQARGSRGFVPQHIVQLHDVGAAIQSLQNFDFSEHLLCPHRFQYLDDTWLVILDVDALVDL